MTDVSTVTLLYTANLRGELALLPRLFSLIQGERRSGGEVTWLVDLGDTCALDSWVCCATEGRAPFLVLESMGYDGVVIGGPEGVPIPPSSLRRLAGTLAMAILIWSRATPLRKRGITVTVAPGDVPVPDGQPAIRVDRSTGALPAPGARPVLGDVPQGCLARVDLAWPAWTVQAARHLAVTPDTPPDPTIAAIVELVESEASAYLQQGGLR